MTELATEAAPAEAATCDETPVPEATDDAASSVEEDEAGAPAGEYCERILLCDSRPVARTRACLNRPCFVTLASTMRIG